MADAAQQDEPGPPGDLFAGFESYCTPVQADYGHLFSDGMIVVDANVLLDLYLYHEQTRDEFMSVLEKVQERLWVPHQAVKEFWRNRDSKIRDPRESDATSEELEKHSGETVNHLRAWSNRVRLPSADKDRLAETISQAFKAVIEEVKKQGADGAKELARDTSSDPLLVALAPLLKGRVGPPFSKEDYDKEFKEAIQRGIDKLPPGYMDVRKEDRNSAGDYLIWVQILREAKTRQQDVLFVTSDNKEDWWRKDDNKDKSKQKSLGPRPELADELMRVSGRRLFMLPPDSLLYWARIVLDIEVSDESVQDVKQVSSEPMWSTRDPSAFERRQQDKRKLDRLLAWLAASVSKDPSLREGSAAEARANADAALALITTLSDPDLQDTTIPAALRTVLAQYALEAAAREQDRRRSETDTSDSTPDEGADEG